MREETGYIWITASGDCNTPERRETSSQNRNWSKWLYECWDFILSETGIVSWFLKVCLPVFLSIILHLLLSGIVYQFPELKPRIEYTGLLSVKNAIVSAFFVALVLCIGTLASKLKACVAEKKNKKQLLYVKIHCLIHNIRDGFCAAENKMLRIKQEKFLALEKQVNDLEKRQKSKDDRYKDKPAFETKKKSIQKDIKDGTNKLIAEAFCFYSDICSTIASFFDFLTPSEEFGSCIRIAQTEPKENNVGFYTTMGRSLSVSKDARIENTERLNANEGIAKIISDGVRQNSTNCLLLVPSITKAIEKGAWKKQKNDTDPSIKSVMILPINFRGVSPQGQPEVRMDGMLYLTSRKGESASPFTEMFGKENADISGGVADFLGCIVYRLTGHLKTFESLHNKVDQIPFF